MLSDGNTIDPVLSDGIVPQVLECAAYGMDCFPDQCLQAFHHDDEVISETVHVVDICLAEISAI